MMDYTRANHMRDDLIPVLKASRRTNSFLPDDLIVVGSAENYKLSLITAKHSGVDCVDKLPDELQLAVLESAERLEMTVSLDECLDVKESRVAAKNTAPAKTMR